MKKHHIRKAARRTMLKLTFDALQRRCLSEDEWMEEVAHRYPSMLREIGGDGLIACVSIARNGLRGERRARR